MHHTRLRFVGLAALAMTGFGLMASCSSKDDDGGDNPSSSAGISGMGISFGGAPPGGGSGAPGTSGSSGAPMQACPEIAELGDCGATSVEANFKTINVLLVIDKSGSMDDKPAGFAVNKWEALKQALGQALANVAGDIHFGLVLYPYSHVVPIPLEDCGATCCALAEGSAAVNVAVEPGTASVPAILDALENTSPGGGTPTAAALAAAHEYYTTGAGAALPGEKYVLLATDGGPNCNKNNSCEQDRCTPYLDNPASCTNNCCKSLPEFCLDDGSVMSQIEELRSNEISTFVVGIPGTETYSSYLDQFAVAGGVPQEGGATNYYAVSEQGGVEGLVGVFTNITTQLVRACDIVLKEQPPAPDEINVAIECELVRKEEDNGSGWELDQTSDPAVVTLKGPICDRIQSQGAKRVDVFFGCPTLK